MKAFSLKNLISDDSTVFSKGVEKVEGEIVNSTDFETVTGDLIPGSLWYLSLERAVIEAGFIRVRRIQECLRRINELTKEAEAWSRVNLMGGCPSGSKEVVCKTIALHGFVSSNLTPPTNFKVLLRKLR